VDSIAPARRPPEDAPISAPEVAPLVAEVEAAGGAAIGAYREPFSGRPLLLASLPIGSVEPTPFQRDLSPTHTKRLALKIEESGCVGEPGDPRHGHVRRELGDSPSRPVDVEITDPLPGHRPEPAAP